MKILYLTPFFQHPSMRGPTRCYFFAKELAQRHELTLLTLALSEIPAPALVEMQGCTHELVTIEAHSAQAGPGRLQRYRQHRAAIRRLKDAFHTLLAKERFDVVLFHGKSIFPVIDGFRELPVVVDFCDATSLRLATRMRYAGRGKKALLFVRRAQIRRVERKLISLTPHVAFISPRDRAAIPGSRRNAPIVPIGVDLDFWQRKTPLPDRKRLVFTGVMNYAPNEDAARYFVEKILPHIRRGVPDVETYIVGRDPSPRILQLQRAHPGVHVTGFVDDVRPYLEQAAVFVAPLRYASGVQNKVLEALAMQVPVVATSVAAAGLRVDGEANPPVRVADREEPFARAVVHLLHARDERLRLAAAGRKYVEAYFVWAQAARRLEQLCLRAAGLKAPQPPLVEEPMPVARTERAEEPGEPRLAAGVSSAQTPAR